MYYYVPATKNLIHNVTVENGVCLLIIVEVGKMLRFLPVKCLKAYVFVPVHAENCQGPRRMSLSCPNFYMMTTSPEQKFPSVSASERSKQL